jgi:hypothetical protein
MEFILFSFVHFLGQLARSTDHSQSDLSQILEEEWARDNEERKENVVYYGMISVYELLLFVLLIL